MKFNKNYIDLDIKSGVTRLSFKFKCEICGKRCKTENGLLVHKARKHKDRPDYNLYPGD